MLKFDATLEPRTCMGFEAELFSDQPAPQEISDQHAAPVGYVSKTLASRLEQVHFLLTL